MMVRSNHIFHLVDQSPWPVTSAISAMTLTSGVAQWFHANDMSLMSSGMLLLILTAYQWWRDVSREATLQGLHTSFVTSGLRLGMVLFIASEVLFFFSFFWTFFHSSLAPTFDIGSQWPPSGIIVFNPAQVPLLNTIILLASGVSVTWAHHAMMEGKNNETTHALIITVILGLYFTALQALEYWEAFFSISDSIYGATFFVTTGFHGLHVIIGTLFLMTCLTRHTQAHFSPNHHFGFEAAAWYWHFVDVVWLFLYLIIYWWGH